MPRTYGKSKGKAKQTRLAFVPAEFTLSQQDEDSNSTTSRNANVRYTDPSLGTLRSGKAASKQDKSSGSTPQPFVRIGRGHSPEENLQSGVAEMALSSQKSDRKEGKKKKKSSSRKSLKIAAAPAPLASPSPPPATQDSDSDSDLEIVHSAKKNTRRQPRKAEYPEPTPPPQDTDSDSDVEIIHSAKKNKRTRNTEPKAADPPEPIPPAQNSDNKLDIVHSARKNMTTRSMKEEQIASPDPVPANQDSDSDLEILHSAQKPTRSRAIKRKRVESSEPEDAHVSEESDAEDVVARPRRKLRRGGAPQPVAIHNDSEEEQEVRGGTSKSPSVPHTPRRDSAQDRIDIEEDLEDLQDSVVKASRTRGNIANSARAQRQLHLEALRRRRAGQKAEDDGEPQLSPQPEDSESENGEDQDADDGEEEVPVPQPQFRNWANESGDSDVESTIGANEDLDRYEDDFVLEDDDEKLGVPSGLEDIPIEFSRHAYKQLKDYFQDAVEWMVHNQLNPAFPRSDPVFMVAFDKLEAEVRGRTGSQLVSSVWNADFRKALLARPYMEITAYPIDLCHPCDACNRSKHPASSDIKLYGKAYSLETLEPLEDADSDEEQSNDEEEEDGQERDRDGYVLPDEDRRFCLGRHCKKNAALAHTLTHWRFHLNEWVVEHLRTTGYFSDKKILKRSQYSQKKKNKHAAKAVNKMIESGEIKKLWRDFHINLRTARESTV
ncbi:uncharacterized protein DSM5745_06579 [Aspergillus mulundensis]|uniref:DUF4211 domain-containing protein n=1 Tax=Aspergillus mulundensis TaxID=1810919 RepID=A0A3D8RR67_9EURO|nr:Uncharacterized protein DSM5745_06579 [Aspergillus mulundensis]RDW76587.1 Uncharacterized protein DSM5745_06579 [Aspergillus mulundensis]